MIQSEWLNPRPMATTLTNTCRDDAMVDHRERLVCSVRSRARLLNLRLWLLAVEVVFQRDVAFRNV